MSKPIIIAEVKTFSPDGFESPYTWDELLELAIGVGDWVSIHVDPRWKGHIKHLETARKNTNKPILAKGFHFCDEDLKRSFDAGADFALVVGRIPGDYHKKCLIEPYFREEFVSIPPEFKIVWNSRDVRALIEGNPPEPKESFDRIRSIRPTVWLCQASNVKTVHDVHPKADAVLVGTHLPTFARSLGLLKALP